MDRLGIKSDAYFREIQLNGGEAYSQSSGSNYVYSSTHSWMMFIPLALAEVLVRPCTFWFLIMIIIETNPVELDYERSYGSCSLFLLHLLLLMFKTLATLQRYHESDKQYNDRRYQVWCDGNFIERNTYQLKVGDCILIKEGESLPADMLLLSSSSIHGTCHFNTQYTMGEGNLVTKSAVPPTFRFLQKTNLSPDFNLDRLQATIKIDPPNSDFSSFSGTIKLPCLPRAVPLKLDHFLLRGSVMTGEDWAIAVVLYVGMETKFWSNVQHSAVKMAFIERKLSNWVFGAVCVVAVLTSIHVLVHQQRSQQPLTISDFLLYMLIYQHLVPLPLYIGLDILSVIYSFQCRDKDSQVFINLNTATGDLGRVQYILADKTGTITKNRLELVAVLLGSKMYTKPPLFSQSNMCVSASQSKLESLPDDEAMQLSPTTAFCRDYLLSFDDLKHKMKTDYDKDLQRFCECVTLCNSVVIRKDNTMLATSADEEALMLGAKQLGFELINRSRDECDIDYFDMCHSYQVLCVKKFSTEVKRMRILVQQEIDDYATLYIKGAYQTLKSMIDMEKEDRHALESCLKDMEEKGLRTIVLCYRQINGEYLSEIRLRAANAMSAALNIDGKLEVLFQELEQNLTFLGVTGVIDHCDAETGEAIEELTSAGVSTWLMSGEGESHTLAAAYQVGLVTPGTDVVSLRGLKKNDECHKRLSTVINQILLTSQTEASALDPVRFSILQREHIMQDNVFFALSIDGESFETALLHNETQRLLLSLMLTAATVCFNGLSPGQKREIAKLMHQGMKSAPIVLSIGDNINDMPMLLETNISVGLQHSNIEQVCDITVSSFSRLAKLVLNEGRRCSFLVSQTCTLFLYSQVLYVMVTGCLTFISDFTPSSPITSDAKVLYGAVFTFFPILFVGATSLKATDIDSIATRRELSKHKDAYLTRKTALKYGVLALLQYGLISAFLFSSFYVGSSTDISTSEVGFLFLFASVCAVNIHCLFEVAKLSVQLLLIEALSTGLALVYYSTNEDGLSAVYVVLETPRLIFGLMGAVLGCAMVSLGKWLFGALLDGKSTRYGKKIIPLHDRNYGLRRIKKSASALLNAYSKHSPSSVGKQAHFEISRKTAAFDSKQTEWEYQKLFLADNRKLLFVLLTLVLATALVPMAFELTEMELQRTEVAYKTIAAAGVVGLLTVYSVRNVLITSSLASALAAVTITFIFNIVLNELTVLVYFYAMAYLLIFLREKWTATLLISLVATVLLVAASSITLSLYSSGVLVEDCFDILGAIFTQIICHTLAGKLSYSKSIQRRSQFTLIKQCEERIAQSDSILACLLPEFVRKQVKDGIRYIAEDKGQVSVIFIDICCFDQICAKYAPMELTALLDDIFQKIDEMCTSLHVAKIETVGKTYLACAGLRDYEFEKTGEYIKIPHAKRCLDLAFAVLSSFRHHKLQSDLSLAFKIGINTGEVIAGVVGFHKPQFSLVGDTVNTGSRMSTTIEKPNCVQISKNTYEMVSDCSDFQFDPRRILVKGKGEMQTYLVMQTPFNTVKRTVKTDIETMEEIGFPQLRSSLLRDAARANISNFSSLDQTQGYRPFDLTEIYAKAEQDQMEKVSFCTCKKNSLEMEFRNKVLEDDIGNIRLGLILYSLILFALFSTSLSTEVLSRHDSIVTTLLCFCLSACGLIVVIFLRSLIHRGIYPPLILAMYSVTSVVITIDAVVLGGLPDTFVDMVIGFLCLLMFHASGLFFRHAVVGSFLIVVPHAAVWGSTDNQIAESSTFFVIFGLQNCIFLYFSEQSQRTYHTTWKLAQKEMDKTEQLVTQMMPVHAFEDLKREQWSTDRLTDVTILYADISGFTAWSAKRTPQEVIGKLSKIFTLFDKVCVSKKVYKVHTIGDCYVALSSTNNSGERNTTEECVRMLSFAFEMVSEVDRICTQDNEHLKMRIGLHVGEVIAGITGSGIVRYDIYGPDVLVANKMESNGKEGRVNVSAQAKTVLEAAGKEEYVFEFNRTVDVREIERTTECFFVRCRN